MEYRTKTQYGSQGATRDIDEGLRTYMLGVYNYMLVALLVTGGVAAAVLNVPALLAIVFSPFIFVLLVGQIGLVWFLSARIMTLQQSTAQMLFWIYSGLMGITIGGILYQYTGASVARVFFTTASVFGAMSLYGYTTKRSLDSMGKFMMIGLFGIIIAMVINWFLQSSALDFALSIMGVIIFTALTAYDTQKIKETYYAAGSSDVAKQLSIMGALRLYLDFINLFIFLLRLLGNQRN